MAAPVAGQELHGKLFRWPRAYDWLLKLIWGKAEGQYRDRVLELVGIGQGQSLLDVGCGTGTLAIAARKQIGRQGGVAAVDASAEIIARARRKAEALGLQIAFTEAIAQDLPFPDASFDAAVSTTVIHCLPVSARHQSYAEIARVLKPGGQLLLVDFGGSAASKRSLFGHLQAHRRFDLLEERGRLAHAGLIEIDAGPLGFSDLHFILAAASRPSERGVPNGR